MRAAVGAVGYLAVCGLIGLTGLVFGALAASLVMFVLPPWAVLVTSTPACLLWRRHLTRGSVS